jgi:anti-sigma regulatory factor (Ser/Thr protein kinase)
MIGRLQPLKPVVAVMRALPPARLRISPRPVGALTRVANRKTAGCPENHGLSGQRARFVSRARGKAVRERLVSLPKTPNLSQTYPAVAESVRRARSAVVEFAQALGAGDAELEPVRLAVSEAVTNAVVHGFRSARPGQVQVTAASAAGELWVLVADDGCGFLHASRNERGHGWGLPVIADASDQFEIAERAGGGTELRMCFRLAGLTAE